MIDINQYKLRYQCKTSDLIFYGKVFERGYVDLVHPVTLEKERIEGRKIKERFLSMKVNKQAASKPLHARPMLTRGRFSKGDRRRLEEYLKECDERICTNY